MFQNYMLSPFLNFGFRYYFLIRIQLFFQNVSLKRLIKLITPEQDSSTKKKKAQITHIRNEKGGIIQIPQILKLKQYSEQTYGNVLEYLEKWDTFIEKQNLLKTGGKRYRKYQLLYIY